MIKMVNSYFILKEIFIYINYRSKLKIILYNKSLLNILDINIIDYRRISGRYIIGERNGQGKEYNSYNDQLIFEGQYLNGKRTGKGKEYNNNGKIIFEGEYLNNKRK